MASRERAVSRYVAYCRVSTMKGEQIDSLEQQQLFFRSYAEKTGIELSGIYADEGKSGTKMKNRAQLLRLLSDAQEHAFDAVLVKDVSRLARNTVDFLSVVRQLKALGIKVTFVNYDQTSSDSSEFTLTLLSAVAQEESANMSKRVKFGKKVNAARGKVPNSIYGYDKTIGDLFDLKINPEEAEVVRRIFRMYTEESIGCGAIARRLNADGLKSKRGVDWSQVAIGRTLQHEIYIGKIINGKQEVEDFLTGNRAEKEKSDWMVTDRPDLAIVGEDVFYRAQHLLAQRSAAFKQNHQRKSEKHLFSQMIKCTGCGRSFLRICRPYANGDYYYSCATRNYGGADACPNTTRVVEGELLDAIKQHLASLLADKDMLLAEITRQQNAPPPLTREELEATLSTLRQKKAKQIEMFELDVITITELHERTKPINAEISAIEQSIASATGTSNPSAARKKLEHMLSEIQNALSSKEITPSFLRSVIDRVEVSPSGQVDIFIRKIASE